MKAYYADEKDIDLSEYSSAPDAEKLFDLLKYALHDIEHVSAYASKQNDNSIRTLKISDTPYVGVGVTYKPIPFIRISGKWVEQAGFKVGASIRVITIKGMVLIVPVRLSEMDLGETR